MLTFAPSKWWQFGRDKKIKKRLNDYIRTHSGAPIQTTKDKDGKFAISFDRGSILEVAEQFNERRIQEHKHQQEVKARERLKESYTARVTSAVSSATFMQRKLDVYTQKSQAISSTLSSPELTVSSQAQSQSLSMRPSLPKAPKVYVAVDKQYRLTDSDIVRKFKDFLEENKANMVLETPSASLLNSNFFY